MSAASVATVDGACGFVLAVHDQGHGLSFWSHADEFGPLFDAAVFSEAEAATFDVSIADDQAEWMAMPVPLAPGTGR